MLECEEGEMAGISPFSDARSRQSGSTQLLGRLEQCWHHDLNWDIFPTGLKQVIYTDKVLLIIKKSSLIIQHYMCNYMYM